MNQLSNKQKALLCYLGLLVIFILVGNSNNIRIVLLNEYLNRLEGAIGRYIIRALLSLLGCMCV